MKQTVCPRAECIRTMISRDLEILGYPFGKMQTTFVPDGSAALTSTVPPMISARYFMM